MNECLQLRVGCTPFVALRRIVAIDASGLAAIAECSAGLDFGSETLLIEALAQAGAYHVRYLTEFALHVFVARLRRLVVTGPGTQEFTLCTRVLAKSGSAARIAVTAPNVATAEILYGIQPFDARFRRDILVAHHRKVFACLRGE